MASESSGSTEGISADGNGGSGPLQTRRPTLDRDYHVRVPPGPFMHRALDIFTSQTIHHPSWSFKTTAQVRDYCDPQAGCFLRLWCALVILCAMYCPSQSLDRRPHGRSFISRTNSRFHSIFNSDVHHQRRRHPERDQSPRAGIYHHTFCTNTLFSLSEKYILIYAFRMTNHQPSQF